MSDTTRSDRTARNAAVLAVAEVVGKAGSLVYTVLAARALDPAGYGAFAFAVSVSLIITSVAAWGFDQLLMQRAGAEPSRLQDAAGRALTSKLVVGLPSFLVVGILLAPSRPSTAATAALGLVFAAALSDLLADTGRAVATVLERQTGVSVALVVNRVATAALAVVALLAGGGLVAISAAYLVGSASGLVVTAIVVGRLGIRLRPAGSIGEVWGMARRSWALGLATVLGLVLFRIDAVMLASIRGDAAVGRYTVAYRMVETVLFVAWSIGRAAFPLVASAEDHAAVQRVVTRTSAAAAAVYTPFAAVALLRPSETLTLLFGDAYGAEAAVALQLLALAPLAFAVSYLLGTTLTASGEFDALLRLAATGAGLNIVLNLALIPVWGEAGAALTSTVSYVVQGLLAWWVVRRRLGPVAPLAQWGPALVGGVAAVLVLLVVDVQVVVDAAAAGLAHALAWWLAARRWTPAQADQVSRMLRGALGRLPGRIGMRARVGSSSPDPSTGQGE